MLFTLNTESGPKPCLRTCWEYISQDDHHEGAESKYIDYQVIGQTVMGKFGSVLVVFSAVSTQLGCVVAYIIFMVTSLVSVVNNSQTVRGTSIVRMQIACSCK